VKLPGAIDRSEINAAFQDAADRLQRDEAERGEIESTWTTVEIQDALWGRLPVAVRRRVPRGTADVIIAELLRHRGDRVTHG
jgi:hypothetical protein